MPATLSNALDPCCSTPVLGQMSQNLTTDLTAVAVTAVAIAVLLITLRVRDRASRMANG